MILEFDKNNYSKKKTKNAEHFQGQLTPLPVTIRQNFFFFCLQYLPKLFACQL